MLTIGGGCGINQVGQGRERGVGIGNWGGCQLQPQTHNERTYK